jgi:hypothetical protein
MPKEKPEFELSRLRAELSRTRQDEIFGGLSPSELAEYNRKSERIHKLAGAIHMASISEKSSGAAKAEQQCQWSKDPETDGPQTEAHQPYRSREKDSKDSFADLKAQSERTTRLKKKAASKSFSFFVTSSLWSDRLPPSPQPLQAVS